MTRLLIAFSIMLVLAGCMSNGSSEDRTPPSQLEIRSFQTREYDTNDTRLVVKAMINVLQDMGFLISEADAELGLLTAQKWTNVDYTKKQLKHAKKHETPLAKTVLLECTANVTNMAGQSRVRVNFQKRILNERGGTMEAALVQDPAFYQLFFSKVDKGIFLQQEGF